MGAEKNEKQKHVRDIDSKVDLLTNLGGTLRQATTKRLKDCTLLLNTSELIPQLHDCGYPMSPTQDGNKTKSISARLSEWLRGDAKDVAIWKNRVNDGQGLALRPFAIACGFGPSEEWLRENNQTEADLAGDPSDYWKDFDGEVWKTFAGWNGKGEPRGAAFEAFALSLDEALRHRKLTCRQPPRYLTKRERKDQTSSPLPPQNPTSSTSDAIRKLLSLKEGFLEQIEAIPAAQSNLVAADLADRVRNHFAQIEPDPLVDEKEILDNVSDFQTMLFQAFHEAPDNPLTGALQRGAAEPLNATLRELVGRGIASPEDGSSVQAAHDAPIGNLEEALLAGAIEECEVLKNHREVSRRGQRDLRSLDIFLHDARARPPSLSDGRRHLDIARLDALAWPIRCLYLGALRVLETQISEIVGGKLDWAPHRAIFRDRLWDPEAMPGDLALLVDKLPATTLHLGPEMVRLNPGTFLMGSPENEAEGRDDERPQHEVHIERPFALARFPVTIGEYHVFAMLDGRGSSGPDVKDPALPRGTFHFNAAVSYSRWLSSRTGADYRPPAESEWEYAARAGKRTRYWWGDDWRSEMANGAKVVGATSPLGRFGPNPWRLSDMLGNVREWCADEFEAGYAVSRSQDPHKIWQAQPDRLTIGDVVLEMEESASKPLRVLRGGSWGVNPQSLRSAFRDGYAPGNWVIWSGFRPARTLFTP